MQIDLSNRTCLVTGGATGIGLGIVRLLSQAGAAVGLTYYKHDGKAVAAQMTDAGNRAFAYELDASDSRAVDEIVGAAAGDLGRIDILVNNAGGLIGRERIATMSDEHWMQVMNINLSSVFRCSRAALRHMPDGGRIINITSLAAHTGGGNGSAAYAAAKAGVEGLTRGLAKELGPRNITVNAIAPGLILDTPFHETFTPEAAQRATIDATALGRAGYPNDVAGAVCYLASDLGSFCTGITLDLNGGSYFR